MKYSTTTFENKIITVTLLSDGLVLIADRNHPRFSGIEEAVQSLQARGYTWQVPEDEQESFHRLFDMRRAVEEAFQLTDRITLVGSLLHFDGKPVESVLADHVLRAIRQGLDKSAYMPFIRFWERVQANPSEHSRENLMRWLMSEEFTVTDDGHIVGYKGVNDDFGSCTAGPGFVNGQYQHGHLDNTPGNVVEVARSYVTHDPALGCAQGLHVGTWKYAHNFGRKTLEVWVDPADVVSVPTDCNGEKMRVSKYTVKRQLQEGYSLAVLDTKPVVEDDDDEDVYYCERCETSEVGPDDAFCDYCYDDMCEDCGESIDDGDCYCDDDDEEDRRY